MTTDSIPTVYATLLTGLYDFFTEFELSNGQLHEVDIKRLKNFCVNPGIARAGLHWLVEKDFLRQVHSGDPESFVVLWEFTPAGAEFTDVLVSKRNNISDPFAGSLDHVPAASFVDLEASFAPVSEVDEGISDIVRYVETNNEFQLPAEERDAVATELRSLQAAVQRGSIRTTVLANAIRQNGVFQFLKEKVPDKAVTALIGTIIGHIAKWLGF